MKRLQAEIITHTMCVLFSDIYYLRSRINQIFISNLAHLAKIRFCIKKGLKVSDIE